MNRSVPPPQAAKDALRILFTNHGLEHRGGTELYIRDLAAAMLAGGQLPMVYSPILGPVAEEIRALGIPVVDSLAKIAESPDIIHGQHHLATLPALLHFPRVPAISVCHGYLHWLEAPLHFPRVLSYVAVDEACRERLIAEEGIPAEKVQTIFNFADLNRFQPRTSGLPEKPKKALLLSNYAGRGAETEILRRVCEASGIELQQFGIGSGSVLEKPEQILAEYDLVFGKARAAIEALVVGAAVILYHDGCLGPLVRPENLETLRRRNFGFSVITNPLTESTLRNELQRYNPAEALTVSQVMRKEASLERAMAELLVIYRKTIREAAETADTITKESEEQATARYLASISSEVLSYGRLKSELEHERRTREPTTQALQEQILCNKSNEDSLQEKLRTAEARLSLLSTQFHLGEHARASLEADLNQARLEKNRLIRELAGIENSRTIRVRNALLRIPGVEVFSRLLRPLLSGKSN